MKFDPDNVKKYNAVVEIMPSAPIRATKVVLGEDYDRLLALYKKCLDRDALRAIRALDLEGK
jgi:hypothetical protein